MATMVGDKTRSDPFAREAEYAKTGTLLKPALDLGREHSGAPFATDRPVPFTIMEGDPASGNVKKTEVTSEAIDLLTRVNKTSNGFKTPTTIDAQEAARRASSIKKEIKMASVGTETREQAYSHKDSRTPDEIVMDPWRNERKPAQPRILVRFKGRFGTFSVPYESVFADGIALVLVQTSGDGVYYEPPQDFEELISISWNDSVAKCHSCVHYKMPDGRSAHTVYLISNEGVEDAKE